MAKFSNITVAVLGQEAHYFSAIDADPTPARITALHTDGTVDLLTNGQDGLEREKTSVKLGEQKSERYAVLVEGAKPAAPTLADPPTEAPPEQPPPEQPKHHRRGK